MAKAKRGCCVVYGEGGLALRVLPNRAAAESWIAKHSPGSKTYVSSCPTHAAARRVFAEQIDLGLTDTGVIDDLIYYGGVSTKWKPVGASPFHGERRSADGKGRKPKD